MNSQIADLCRLIEEVREELIQLGANKPFTDPEVVKISQELDQLLNEYEFLRHDDRYEFERKWA
ncbi:aspartyl-phosphate phosphatase Spo0E family protein [Desulfitobacterium metallireducens]|uniref:Sporulation protein Spo0E n=1 Tax=Desulfitobacterium metallireducens DSM 15288 TaxID=871968 RepID=W0E7N7_9FIRM|nr:aspartyl-phosphate phosphatase Spo0E family protein [Desulfitobacterium metallireducens]AHF06777.1 sporulation protein Spo0E [Desulfitobacterium metallireducens DSM 15288]